jgi:hypothetical protein
VKIGRAGPVHAAVFPFRFLHGAHIIIVPGYEREL